MGQWGYTGGSGDTQMAVGPHRGQWEFTGGRGYTGGSG